MIPVFWLSANDTGIENKTYFAEETI